MKFNPVLTTIFKAPQATKVDGYKLGHIDQYVPGTKVVGSNLTPRSARLAEVIAKYSDNKMIFIGIQVACIDLVASWQETFFNIEEDQAIKAYKRRVKNYLGEDHGGQQIKAMRKLHKLGYLPIQIKALPEGSRVDMGIPVFTVRNTHPDFYWLTNYLETYLSDMVWPMCNAASIADLYLRGSKEWAKVTSAPEMWAAIANHCFAARGHRGDQDAMMSGMSHLLVGNVGTDTLWAIDGIEHYYGADSDKELIGCSVNAFEHATATQRIAYYRNVLGFTAYGEAEYQSVLDILTRLYPTGIVSYVADSEDYFFFMEKTLPRLMDAIKARTADANGLCKFVIRPDSSPKSPIEIVMGDHFATTTTPDASTILEAVSEGYDWIRQGEYYYQIVNNALEATDYADVPAEVKGSLELMADAAGCDISQAGYAIICEKLGLIYGEAITPEMQDTIYRMMANSGWCVSNILMGIGSWGFLKNSSRDTYGIAIKGTNSIVEIDGLNVPISMQKTPKTAMGSKKSALGLLRVEREDGKFVLYEDQIPEQEEQGLLKTILLDGKMFGLNTRESILKQLEDTK